jgi:hypothetical protein
MSTTNRTSSLDHGTNDHDALCDAALNAVTGGSFVSFGDIKGESTDKDHKDWISLL